jgi:hypothetical protein
MHLMFLRFANLGFADRFLGALKTLQKDLQNLLTNEGQKCPGQVCTKNLRINQFEFAIAEWAQEFASLWFADFKKSYM